jgi:hypothetical protein
MRALHLPFTFALLLGLAGCMVTAMSEDVVRTDALRDTQCADISITRGEAGAYIAKGCGMVRKYTCDRPAGMGYTKTAAIQASGCRRIFD